jgi:hypothetical protein
VAVAPAHELVEHGTYITDGKSLYRVEFVSAEGATCEDSRDPDGLYVLVRHKELAKKWKKVKPSD